MNNSSTQASYNRQQRKDKQTGSEVNEWTTRQHRPRIIDNNVRTNLFVCPYVVVYYTRPVLTSGSFIDFWSCLFVLMLLSIIRGLCWPVVNSLTSDPVCLSLRCCLLYEACVDQWFIHWLLILFVCPYVVVYYTKRKDKQTGSEVNEWTTRQHRPRMIDNNVRTNKQDQKSRNEQLVNTGLV
jgi:hypothetical protein